MALLESGFVFNENEPLSVLTIVPIIIFSVSENWIDIVMVSLGLKPDPHISIDSLAVNSLSLIVSIVAWGCGASFPDGPIAPAGPGGPLIACIPGIPGSPFSPIFPLSPWGPWGPWGPSLAHANTKIKDNAKIGVKYIYNLFFLYIIKILKDW